MTDLSGVALAFALYFGLRAVGLGLCAVGVGLEQLSKRKAER